jgi:hypothetical protein
MMILQYVVQHGCTICRTRGWRVVRATPRSYPRSASKLTIDVHDTRWQVQLGSKAKASALREASLGTTMQETSVFPDISEVFKGAWTPSFDSSAEWPGGYSVRNIASDYRQQSLQRHDEDMPCDSARQGMREGTYMMNDKIHSRMKPRQRELRRCSREALRATWQRHSSD